MNDNALIAAFGTQLETSITSAGWNYVVVQKDQPTQEGAPSGPTVFLEKLFDHDYGFPSVSNAYDSVNNIYTQTEKQIVETTFQISALVPQNPNDLSIPTAADVVKQVKLWIQSRVSIAALYDLNIAMLRVTDIRTNWFDDDSEQFENHPNFDIIVQHEDSITMVVPAAASAVGSPSPLPGYPGIGTFPVL